MRILKAYNNFYVAIIFILFYHGIFLALFQIHPKIHFASGFLLYVLVVLLHKNSIVLMNRWLFFAIIVLIPSVLVGLFMGWNYVDIAADIVRYLAPFLGFTVGVLLLNHLNYYRILYILYGLLALHMISYYYSVISKASHVIQGGPLIEYASKYSLEVHTLYFFIVYFLLKNKLVFGVKKVLLIGYVVGYIVNPIFLMSKARTVTMLLSFALIFFLYSNFKDRILMIIFTLFIVGTSYLYFDGRTYQQAPFETYYSEGKDLKVTPFSRIQDTIELIKTNDYHTDASTSFRLTEIKNITNMLYESPQSLFFGFGSGALWYDDYAKIEGGILQENYRPDGGVHDIFAMPFAYVFRYGFIGLLLMFSFVVYHYRKILVNNVNAHQDTIAASLKLFIIISLVADIFVPVHAYGSVKFGFFIAIGVVLQSKLNGQYNTSKYTMRNPNIF
jgi:hypothetical protein